MIGHIVGYGAQITFAAACGAAVPLQSKIICQPLALIIHEFIVEPTVDTMVANGIRSILTNSPLKWPDLRDPVFYCCIAGSILSSQLAILCCDHWFVDCMVGVAGASIGEWMGKRFFLKAEEIAVHR